MASIWRGRPRNYHRERRDAALDRTVCVDHPLAAPTVIDAKVTSKSSQPSSSVTKSEKSAPTKAVAFDPLSGGMLADDDPLGAMAGGSDPLSMSAASPIETKSTAQVMEEEYDIGTFEPWEAKKAGILSKYTTSEKLSITTSFLSQSDREKVVVKAQTSATMADKVKNRLEQLDDFEEGSMKEMMNLSQQEYVKRIDELHKAMSDAWEGDQRVKTLKIAIQCSKLLGDTNVIKFYPSKFVLITDILDTFGRLVYDRIWRKSTISVPGSSVPVMLPEKFTVEQVPDSAKETCRNWFFKIASIRELVPRFFVETAILRCYNFLTTDEFAEAMRRLTNMIRGIGNPLVAVYARCYLCRVGALVAPHVRSHLMPNLYDFMNAYTQLNSDHVNNVLAMQRVDFADYLQLFVPGLEWMLQCVANRAQESVLEDILVRSAKKCNTSLFLHSVLQTFEPSFTASRAAKFVDMIKDCDENGFSKHLLYRVLGMNLLLCDPPSEERMGILRDVWKDVTKLKDPAEYIACAEVWIEFPCKHFGKKNVNTFLADLMKHVTVERAFENHYSQLQSMVSKIVAHMHDFSALFSMDKFLPFIDVFQRDAVKVDVCKVVVEAFIRHQVDATSDPVTINGMMYVCKVLHDSINALSLRDEERQISNYIVNFLRRVTHGRDLEAHLNFLVDARAGFANLQPVVMFLVQRVNSLAVETHRMVKGNHSRKTSAFVRACAAYTFITIPGVTDAFMRLNLYLLSGQVALLNQAITQGDSFFKAAISTLSEIPKTQGIEFAYIIQCYLPNNPTSSPPPS
ncbi:VPS35 endosomal protein-sorting factor-like, partial [Sycon ciliatum]|uniref:VPS35 endosomal protein-sorting factor-like n=1 Tax=Sycon ciliatum TaxID=27933 RepID=UPI0031F67C97